MAQITSLSLMSNGIGDDGAKALASALAGGAMAQLKELYLHGNRLTGTVPSFSELPYTQYDVCYFVQNKFSCGAGLPVGGASDGAYNGRSPCGLAGAGAGGICAAGGIVADARRERALTPGSGRGGGSPPRDPHSKQALFTVVLALCSKQNPWVLDWIKETLETLVLNFQSCTATKGALRGPS